jgi:hypothetical protein
MNLSLPSRCNVDHRLLVYWLIALRWANSSAGELRRTVKLHWDARHNPRGCGGPAANVMSQRLLPCRFHLVSYVPSGAAPWVAQN